MMSACLLKKEIPPLPGGFSAQKPRRSKELFKLLIS